MIDKIKEICLQNHVQPIVILKTPLAGETVEGMMGVDHNLKEYVLIFKYDKGYSGLNSEMTYAFYELEREIHQDFGVMEFNVESISSIDDMINELHERDQYQVVWRDNNYKEPIGYNSKLFRDSLSLNVSLVKTYSLKVTFDEIKKYCSDKSSGYVYRHEFFLDLLRDNKEFNKVVNNHSFPGDIAEFEDMYFCEDSVVFVFRCKLEKNIVCDENEYNDERLSGIINKFEYSESSDLDTIGNFDKLSNKFKKSFENIINDGG